MRLRIPSARRAIATLAAAVLVVCVAGCSVLRGNASAARELLQINVSSPEIRPGGPLPAEYTCEGGKGSPMLTWSSQPLKDAKTFAVVVDDNSAPDQAVHWIIYNIDHRTTVLAAGIPAEGATSPDGTKAPEEATQAQLLDGTRGYSAPCRKPAGEGPGNYRFSVYALSGKVATEEGDTISKILHKIAELTIARGRLTAVDIE
ncbi:YbhB/YbcL family Raf kinase inhibitor-like protein [Nonomuraea sp. NPDC050310]|uniref:YbhB/YbcL family Raf kinase inhibitor-like protein n=1 Tax=unclassified Nonomuraea TaxID=2593643 RepID=UPI0034073D52